MRCTSMRARSGGSSAARLDMASRQLPANRKRRRWTCQSDPFSPRFCIASGVLGSDIFCIATGVLMISSPYYWRRGGRRRRKRRTRIWTRSSKRWIEMETLRIEYWNLHGLFLIWMVMARGIRMIATLLVEELIFCGS